jgi:phosphoglycolate phosphatase-like HAD superfamily hydrolase
MYLLQGLHAAVCDFDKTVAETFEPSPNGHGVQEAYYLAVGEVLGRQGQRAFHRFGLQNRAPTELVRSLLSTEPKYEMLAHARRYFHREASTLLGLVPVGKGVPLSWNEVDPTEVVGEMVVRAKLKVLLNEIGNKNGKQWPAPCEGVLAAIDEFRKNDLPLAIISSGHELFITKTFESWGVDVPVLLTDDDLRGHTTVSPEMRVKPHAYLFSCLLEKWRRLEKKLHSFCDSKKFVYFGDDLDKDGRFAENSQIRFGWYDPAGNTCATMRPNQFRFRHWRELTTSLQIA